MKMPDITIENGAISLGDMENPGEDNMLAEMMVLFVSQNGELKDGKLVSHVETDTYTTSLSITLLEDGMISVDLLGGDTVLQTCVYAPAEIRAE
ncbi:MAG: hypothetical protein ILP14_03405 [Oscillospiraceae bacterium]|nr:hypothetical protein [Oscillospiraceae bacterium]